MKSSNRNLGLVLAVIGAFFGIFFYSYDYTPANGYKPAVLLKRNGDPLSLKIREEPVVVLSGWGTPEGFNKEYDDYLFWRTSGGERVTKPNQACSQWHVGSFPFQVEISRLPFAIGRKVEGMERLWDSVGAYKITEDGQSFIPIVNNKAGDFPYAGGDAPTLYKKDLDGVDIVAMKDYVSSRSADSGGAPLIRYTPDPRNGIDYLAGIFLIKKPNGINDYYEIEENKK